MPPPGGVAISAEALSWLTKLAAWLAFGWAVRTLDSLAVSCPRGINVPLSTRARRCLCGWLQVGEIFL
jgi:hypothetical protein